MFKKPSPSADTPSSQVLVRRALLFAAALVVLWVLTGLLPDNERPAEVPVPQTRSAYEALTAQAAPEAAPDAAPAHTDVGTVARNGNAGGPVAGAELRRDGPSVFSPGFLLVVVLLGGAGWWAFRLRRGRPTPGTPTARLTTLGSLPLGPQQSLHLVACGDDVLLVGQNASGLAVLGTYERRQFERSPAPVHALPPAEPARVQDVPVQPVAARPAAAAPLVEVRDVPLTEAPASFAALLRQRAPHLFDASRAA